MRIARFVLWLSLLTFTASGLAFTTFPQSMARLAQIELPTDTARTDFMAVHGGLEPGFAAFLLACMRTRERIGLGLLASGWVLTGLAAVRLIGILLSEQIAALLYLLLALESLGSVLSFWAARRATRSHA